MDVLDAFKLTGRVAAVTGAGSGIGRASAETLAAAGASVACGDIDVDAAQETADAIEAGGGRAIAVRTDVAMRTDVDALVDGAVARFGRLDVMCNVAGIPADGLIADATDDQLDRVIAVNQKGTLYGCQAAIRAMRQQGSGSIINVSSGSIDAPAKGYGLYAMTKAAITMLTMTLAVEAGPLGIRVNAIAPGTTITAFTARHTLEADGTVNQARYDAFVGHMKKISPIGLVGEAIDQAYLILFLASDAAKFCTGQIWRANGGQTFAW